jgi:hypothetical protein
MCRRDFCLRLLLVLLCLVVARPVQAADTEGAEGLYRDLERIVAAQEAGEWFVDAAALREIEQPLVESVCRATKEARDHTRARMLRERLAAGDPRRWMASRGWSSEMKDALSAERRLLALDHALAIAAVPGCPFWVAPEPGFRGRQTDFRKWTLSVETGGGPQLRLTKGTLTFGGGGNGRVLAGYGFASKLSLLAGAEFGGNAMVRPGTKASQFVINYLPAVPVVLRLQQPTFHLELETAPVALFQADDTRFSWGGRIGVGLGFITLRQRGFLPWAGIAASYEAYASGARPTAHYLRGGFRVGVMWPP